MRELKRLNQTLLLQFAQARSWAVWSAPCNVASARP